MKPSDAFIFYLVVDQLPYAQRHLVLMIKLLKRIMGERRENRFFLQESFVKPRGESEKAGMPTRQLTCHAGNRKHLILCQMVSLRR